METIGDRIKEARKRKGLSLMKLANMLKVSDTALSKIETGKIKSITIDLGKGITKALEISFNEMFDIEVPKNQTEVGLMSNIEQLEKRIVELEEQLQDKRTVINLIFSDDVLFSLIPNYDHNKSREQNLIDLITKNKKSWEDLKKK